MRGAPLHSLRDGNESGSVNENDLQRDGKTSEKGQVAKGALRASGGEPPWERAILASSMCSPRERR